VIGFTPQQVADMSIWQFAAAIEGYNDAHSTDNATSQAELDDMAEYVLALHNECEEKRAKVNVQSR